MNAKFVAVLDVLVNALGMYLNSIAKIDLIQALFRRSAKRVFILALFLGVLLLSTWASLLGIVFVYLLSIPFSLIQALSVVLGINLIGLIIVLIGLMCAKKQLVMLRRSSTQILLAYIVKAVNDVLNKHK